MSNPRSSSRYRDGHTRNQGLGVLIAEDAGLSAAKRNLSAVPVVGGESNANIRHLHIAVHQLANTLMKPRLLQLQLQLQRPDSH
ncbi:hypothetical protein FOIG_09557 [Fusarium odoratissimum NRRL 54006]|uniref:Uncharacterized protein n=4 Tax=Fusarium oxysporum species complex TaxID=171631 RepID=A0A420MDN8_FUSOX|nr:uncharacterized protein FOIG_09557 [Fusarium odoratissimum NRRL 54006]EWZ28744.1 hypothetical protein FOZG_17612 [Fusarium oxysporum Fo47]EWZ85474.1 hypothetical protein FOWG_11972 [Fusarium oxysporum f. sp. lycopersici MN25]KAJ4266655.1 hypothetical protein NW764_015315 [Fusarium oxysporum]RKK07055.1 hypothetical protein BFJ65_g18222 [Fusarium oxysporum f. sp. cepae]EXL97999.1 hypothetical protein FOIG_09557 [Fusarium odoratissimum NRRL 54006]